MLCRTSLSTSFEDTFISPHMLHLQAIYIALLFEPILCTLMRTYVDLYYQDADS